MTICCARSMPGCVRAIPHSRIPYPPVDIYERDGEVLIVAQVPGRRLEELSLELSGDSLTLSGEGESTPPGGGRMLLEERRRGRFERIIRLPSWIDRDAVSARLADGLLRIRVPLRAATSPEWTTEDSLTDHGAGTPGRAVSPEKSEEGSRSG